MSSGALKLVPKTIAPKTLRLKNCAICILLFVLCYKSEDKQACSLELFLFFFFNLDFGIFAGSIRIHETNAKDESSSGPPILIRYNSFCHCIEYEVYSESF